MRFSFLAQFTEIIFFVGDKMNEEIEENWEREIDELQHDEEFMQFWWKICDKEPWNCMSIGNFVELSNFKGKTRYNLYNEATCVGVLDFFHEIVNVWEELIKHHNPLLDFRKFCKEIAALQNKKSWSMTK